MVELSADQIESMLQVYKDQNSSLTAEQKQANVDLAKATMADEAKKAEAFAELQETFKASDTNGNGKLNRSEFLDNMKKREANATAKGYHVVAVTDDYANQWFDKMCEVVGADEEGLSFEQLMGIQKQVGAAWMAKNA